MNTSRLSWAVWRRLSTGIQMESSAPFYFVSSPIQCEGLLCSLIVTPDSGYPDWMWDLPASIWDITLQSDSVLRNKIVPYIFSTNQDISRLLPRMLLCMTHDIIIKSYKRALSRTEMHLTRRLQSWNIVRPCFTVLWRGKLPSGCWAHLKTWVRPLGCSFI